MNRLPKIILLAILMITFAPQLRAQQDSSGAKTYEEYEQQSEDEPATSSGATEEPAGYRQEDAQEGYAPLFIKPEASPERQNRQIQAAEWQQMTHDNAFQYEEPARPKPAKSSGTSSWEKFFVSLYDFLQSTAGRVLLIIIVSILVIILVVRVFQLNGNVFFSRKDKKLPGPAEEEDADHYVPDDWDQAILQAAASGNYRLAVRHSYRYLIQLLRETERISFQTGKTNYQYAYELSGTNLYQPFIQLTRNYEYAWYGGFDIARERFEAYYEQVKGIKKELY